MHVNRQTLLGRISKRPELRYNAKGTPFCSLTLAIEKSGREGQVYTSWHQVEISGKFAEELSVTLEAGDEILVEGEHQHRSLVDPRTQEKKKWCVLSTWGVLERNAHAGVDHADAAQGDVPNSTDEESAVPTASPELVPARKARKPSRTRASMLQWPAAASTGEDERYAS